jgi:hypothetical protein
MIRISIMSCACEVAFFSCAHYYFSEIVGRIGKLELALACARRSMQRNAERRSDSVQVGG